MNKLNTKWWLVPILAGMFQPVFSQNYQLQICAFSEAIESSFFRFAGLENITQRIDNNNFHKYYWGDYIDQESAKLALNLFKSNPLLSEFKHLKVIASDHTKSLTPISNKTDHTIIQPTDFQLFSRKIKFKNANLSLEKSEVETLEEVANILNKNPDLKLRIYSDTRKVNGALKAMPADVVEHFLLAQNIPAYRLKIVKKTTKRSKYHQVLMTLVDLKEEIVLDRFGNKGLIVKQNTSNPSNDILE